jgi:hypothetical protein
MNRSFFSSCVAGAASLACIITVWTITAGSAKGATYTDALNDTNGGSGPSVDISNVVITNDASNITFKINLNSTANIGPTASYFGNYEVGIQVGGGAGGQTSIVGGLYGTGDPTVGNPYSNSIGISTGMNYFIGSFLDTPTSSGGATLLSYSSAAGWTQIVPASPPAPPATTAEAITEVYTGTPSISFTFPLSAFGLTAGNTFKFDVWSSYGQPGGQGAYDALDNTTLGTPPPGGDATAYRTPNSGAEPWNGGTYDSATAPGSTLASYTVTAATVLGDINNDGHFNAADISSMEQALTNPSAYPNLNSVGDLNGDGVVTIADLQKMLLQLKNGQGSSSVVPEPASIALASLAGIALLAVARNRGRRTANWK